MKNFGNAVFWLGAIVAWVLFMSGLWWVINLVVWVDYGSFLLGAAVSWFFIVIVTVYVTIRAAHTPQGAQEGGSEAISYLD